MGCNYSNEILLAVYTIKWLLINGKETSALEAVYKNLQTKVGVKTLK